MLIRKVYIIKVYFDLIIVYVEIQNASTLIIYIQEMFNQ